MRLMRLHHVSALVVCAVGLTCCAQYSRFTTDSGGRGYYITCANEYARCEAQASELCGGSYQKLASRHRSKDDMKEMMVTARTEYNLVVECDEPESSASH